MISGFLDPAMSGGYNWLHLPRDTFFNTHSNLFPGLIYLASAYLTHLNAFSLLYVGVVLQAAAVCLLYHAFVGGADRGRRWPDALLLAPIL
ncbi:MAG TPA: hypothetical protein VLZ81_10240, partial [Blastocatellia bacterium]|nr:hypothetical protein [Blastocatellia bacterium]